MLSSGTRPFSRNLFFLLVRILLLKTQCVAQSSCEYIDLPALSSIRSALLRSASADCEHLLQPAQNPLRPSLADRSAPIRGRRGPPRKKPRVLRSHRDRKVAGVRAPHAASPSVLEGAVHDRASLHFSH